MQSAPLYLKDVCEDSGKEEVGSVGASAFELLPNELVGMILLR